MLNKIFKLVQYVDEYGVLKFLYHIIEKIIWHKKSREFASVGKNTFVQMPYEINGANHISIGNSVTIRKRLQLETFSEHNGHKFEPNIVIGDNVSINFDVHIAAINNIIIEDNVLIASKVFITDHFHGKSTIDDINISPSNRVLYSKGKVHIKKNVWIGENVAIMPGVTIGDNSIIGANSVVTKSIPPNCVAVGNPAKVIREIGEKIHE